MKLNSPPNAWSIFAVPAVFALFYCVMQCLYFPKLPSMVPIHFDASGVPDAWTRTGPLILLAMAFLIVLFMILAWVFTRGMEQPRTMYITAVIVAGVCGAQSGAFLEVLRFMQYYGTFHLLLPLLFALGAAAAEGIVLLAVSRKTNSSIAA